MSIRAPHFLLMSEAAAAEEPNRWRFVLASADGDQKLVASDSEPEVSGERLELLSVVRGLEALDQPSQVTLLTDSRYVSQGIASGLNEWRANDWCWERFGELAPVKNRDLWQRVDRALRFHRVDCRTWRFDPLHAPAAGHSSRADAENSPPAKPRRTPATRRRASQTATATIAHTAPVAQERRTSTAGAGARLARVWSVCRRAAQQATSAMKELHLKAT